MLELVGAKDDVPDYWAELGKVDLQMADYDGAYYAFTRAYELNRSDPDILRAVTELALRSGDVMTAQTRASELQVVSPGDPWVKLADGWASFAQSHFDKAIADADALLASTPNDPSATILKARSLLSLQREDDAITLLTEQAKAQPSEPSSLMLLAKIYDGRSDWSDVVAVERRIATLAPSDHDNALLMVEAALRTGVIEEARQASARLLKPNADSGTISAVLDLWTNYWPSAQRIADAKMYAERAKDFRSKLIYAAFLSRFGSPQDAINIASPSAQLPVNASNSEANAVVADALARSGNIAGAKPRFDAVLSFDPGNSTALRGRAELELKTGNSSAAIEDLRKLVTVIPNSASARLLLARAFAAAGNSDWSERTLWTAFQDIPADEQILDALRVNRKGNLEALNELNAEFQRQRSAKLNRGLL